MLLLNSLLWPLYKIISLEISKGKLLIIKSILSSMRNCLPFTLAPSIILLFKATQFHISSKKLYYRIDSLECGLLVSILIYEMEICFIGKPSSDTAAKPKRTPKQKKVETINSDSDSEFGIPKKTTPPKGEDYF